MKWIFLYILISRGDGSVKYTRTPHPTYQSCYNALHATQIKISNGNENELGIVVFCGDERLQRISDSGQWYTVKINE